MSSGSNISSWEKLFEHNLSLLIIKREEFKLIFRWISGSVRWLLTNRTMRLLLWMIVWFFVLLNYSIIFIYRILFQLTDSTDTFDFPHNPQHRLQQKLQQQKQPQNRKQHPQQKPQPVRQQAKTNRIFLDLDIPLNVPGYSINKVKDNPASMIYILPSYWSIISAAIFRINRYIIAQYKT